MHENDELLFKLIHKNDIEEARALIASGKCDFKYVNYQKYNALTYAAKYCPPIAHDIFKTGQSDVGSTDYFGETALMGAVYSGDLDLVVALLQTGQSNPNSVCLEGSAFSFACYRRTVPRWCNDVNVMPKIARELIASGQIDLDHIGKDKSDKTKYALRYAVEHRCYNICYWLVSGTTNDDPEQYNKESFQDCVDKYNRKFGNGEFYFKDELETVLRNALNSD